MQSKIIETSFGPVEYTLEGDGPTVLIIHGGNGNCFANLRQELLLQTGYQVLIPSRPGYGKTDISLGKSAGEQAEMLKALLEALHIQGVALIGASAGGPTALEFVRRYPGMTRCLILEEAITTTWVPVYSPQYWGMRWCLHPKRQEKFWQGQRKQFEDDQEAYLVSLAKIFSRCKPQDVVNDWDAEDIAWYRESLYSFDYGPGFIHTLDHKAKNIQDIAVPVLIMHSPHDKNVPFHHALYAQRLIKGSELFEVSPLSHLIYMGKGKDKVISKRLAFLDAHAAKTE